MAKPPPFLTEKQDAKRDKKLGIKENSKADLKMDRKLMGPGKSAKPAKKAK